MTLPITVMISHSSRNRPETEAIVRCLQEQRCVTVLWDDTHVRGGHGVHPQILKMLNDADAVVVHATKEALASPEVRDELSRAHQLHKPIVWVVELDDQGNAPRLACVPLVKRSVNRLFHTTLLVMATVAAAYLAYRLSPIENDQLRGLLTATGLRTGMLISLAYLCAVLECPKRNTASRVAQSADDWIAD